MKIKPEELAKIIEEETVKIIQENILQKMLGDVTDLYTRLNVPSGEKEKSGSKVEISDQTFKEIISKFRETFKDETNPITKDKNVVGVLENTLIGAFSSVVEAAAPKADVENTPEVTTEEISLQLKNYQGDYYIAYNVIGNLFLKAFPEIYKKVEFELNRQVGYLIKNTFKGNLEAFKTNLTKAFANLKTSVEAEIKSDDFKKGLLNQQTHRKLVVLEKNIDKIQDQNILLKLEKEMETLWLRAKVDQDLKDRAKEILRKSVSFRFRKVKKALLATGTEEEYKGLFTDFILSSPESAKEALMQKIIGDEDLRDHIGKIRQPKPEESEPQEEEL